VAADREALLGRLADLRARCVDAVGRRQALDPDPDDAFRGLYVSDDQATRLAGGPDPDPIGGGVGPGPDPGSRLAGLRLDPMDLELLVVAMAPDLDPRFEKLYGYLHDDLTRRRASVGLALELVGAHPTDADARARLVPGSHLLATHLVAIDDGDRPLLTRSLRVPDRVAAHLLGDDRPDAALAAHRRAAPVLSTVPDRAVLARVLVEGPQLVHLSMDRYGAAASVAATLLAAAGLGAVVVDLGSVPDDRLLDVLPVAVRESHLTGSGLVLLGLDALAGRPGGAPILRSFADAPVTVVAIGGLTWDPRWSDRVPLSLATPVLAPDEELVPFRLSPEGVIRARRSAALAARAEDVSVDRGHLAAGARAQNGAGLERLARHVVPKARWADLVLPSVAATQLRELAARVRHRPTVLEGWSMGGGASRGQGVTALFSGESGTGKTMSAEVLAGDLGLDLYVVDLATVVDKYIGETEKNLDRIFDEADQVNGVLLFDEADAIFGKRSEVSDSKDRYANVEIAYLLQRMERFDGIAVLTTNLRSNLDDAFLRRLDALIDFPSPDADARRRLWQTHLPTSLPVDDDIDLDFLAQAFEVAGGNIRNITLTAAFLAAEAGRFVGMSELVRATEREYRKLGRLRLDTEFGEYHDLVAVGSREADDG
jgi:hypothetical protein